MLYDWIHNSNTLSTWLDPSGRHQGPARRHLLFLLTLGVITSGLLLGPLNTTLYVNDIALIGKGIEKPQDKLEKRQKGSGVA
ncbi:unnamed protein product [Haemonchus placei]|uniref:Neur_chan_memb domain-containing protein n=1 Tax=Haemonchus placei TaxID=6290 RepID=A0A0N4W6S4_HAEPC|nr:unnamed protein product [Haemonchus placei]